MATSRDGDAIERLTAKVRRFEAGQDVDFSTEREDAIGELYEAVGDLAADAADRERERQIEAIVRNTISVIYIKDREGTYRFANRAAADYFGRERDEIVGLTDRDLFDEETAAEIRAHDQRVMEAGETLVEEVDRPIDGEERVFLDNKFPYRDEDGDVIGVMGVSRDVTERKERERELRERERDLREHKQYIDDILDAVDDVFYVLDRDGNRVRWNDSVNDVLGYSDEELASRRPLENFAPEDREAVERGIEAVFETGSARIEASYVTKDGERIPYEFTASRVEGPDGEPVLAGIGRDISDRKERERALRERERRLEEHREYTDDILDAVDDVIYVIGADGTFRRWNRSLGEVTGYADEEIADMHALEFFAEENDETAAAAIEEVFETGDTRVEMPIVTQSGESIPYEIVASRVEDPDGEPVLAGIGRDVSDRKERERQLAARSAAMEQSIDGMAILDEGGEYAYVNRAHADVYGYDDPNAMVGESWRLCYEDDEIERLEPLVESLRSETDSWRGEAVGRRADGTAFPQELSLTALADGRLVCVVRDVTERKERERELERTRDLLRRVQEMAGVGGWELDVASDPQKSEWTDAMYRLHDLPPDGEIDTETIVERYHPDDRPRVRETIETSLETGTGYEIEARMEAGSEGTRWVRASADPIYDDGDLVRFRGTVQDVTDQKERELALRSLHESTRELLGAETDADAAAIVVDAAADALDVGGVGVYLLDERSNRLEPAAHDALGEGGPPAVGPGDDSLLWDCFVTETPTVFEDAAAVTGAGGAGTDGDGGLLVPVGDHGVFVLTTGDGPVEGGTRRLVETLVATAEAAFDRIESESAVRERDAELEARNRRLRRQMQITDIIRRIDRSLIGASERAEIERAVCDRLVEADQIAFAWIGRADAAGEPLSPAAWAGAGGDYLDAVSLSAGADAPEPAVRAAETGSPTVVGNVLEGVRSEPWRERALAREFHSAVSVPLSVGEYFYGVLSVYADEPDAFGDLERSVFAELGENIANSMAAVETRRALHADALIELTLRIEESEAFLSRLAREAGVAVTYEGLATHSADETRLFVSLASGDADAIAEALDGLVSVTDCRLVSEAEESCLFEVTVDGDVLAARLVRRGASPREIRVDESGMEVVVDVPTRTDVRGFVDAVGEVYPSVELAGRRTVERATHTREELVSALFEGLTDRQLEVLRTAYHAGFFEWPRTSTGEDVAELLDVTQPTVNRHLRLAQQRLLEQLFEGPPGDVGTVEGASG